MPVPAAPKEPDPSETRVAAVKQVLDTKLAQYGGTWSAIYIDLESGRDVTVNDEKLVAASLVKLYIMLSVFDGIEHGTITDDANVDALLKQMITVSSNEAANGLLSRIGNGDDKAAIATVTAIAQRYGFTSSEELRTLTGMASGNAVENWTSTRDCGSFLSQVYAGTLVSKNASERMMQLLLGQTRRTKIPAGVPSGVKVANKTGELAAVQNDVAIVFGTHPYVLAVMTLSAATRDAQGVRFGVPPRGRLNVAAMAHARALMQGRDFVMADDVRSVVVPVLAHRGCASVDAGCGSA